MSQAELALEMKHMTEEYNNWKSKGLKLDMSRGKPGKEQLALTQDMLGVISSPKDCITESGLDCRNYGLLDGIPEAKRIFSDILGIPTKNLIVAGNSSLNIMYDEMSRAMLFGVVGSERPWCREEKIKFLCPVPGYDRHFSICELMGIEMICVDMTPEGPDMDTVERLVSADPSIKGIWCVPKYSNPDGIVYSDETIRRFAALRTAAPDFRIFWDNAYVVHSFDGEPAEQLNLFHEAAKYGNQDKVLMFTSTSKISFPGSGLAVLAASDANIRRTCQSLSIQTIGYDKLNQMRHVKFFGSAEGIMDHMRKHAAIIKPKFEILFDALDSIAEYGITEWIRPKGGYFIGLNVPDGCASRVYQLMNEAGVTVTHAGATFPYGKDPRDRNLRLAPTFPSNEELTIASKILTVCVRLASVEKLLNLF